jgi:hypothetical protein
MENGMPLERDEEDRWFRECVLFKREEVPALRSRLRAEFEALVPEGFEAKAKTEEA